MKVNESTQKFVPYPPCATSYGVGWKGLEAVRYRNSSTGVEFTLPPVSYHCLVLISRPPEKLHVRYEGVKRDMPPAAGSIAVVPAGSSQLVRWQGSKDTLLVYLEPSLVARVAAESFEFDRSRTVVPPLHGLNVVRQGLAAILDSQPDIKVVAEAANGEEVYELYNQIHPDVLVLDLRMPKKSGLQVTSELASQRGLNFGIVVMTFFDGEEDIRQVLSAGAKAFLNKGSEPEEIRDAVRSVARGERYLPANIGLKLADSVSRPELSRRETEVLQYLARGRSNKEIGQYLCVSEGTVKHHVKSILGKLGAIGRTEATAIAARRGLVHLV